MKYIILIATLGSLISCKSKQDAKLDRYYEIFKTRNYSDSTYSLFALYIQKYHYDSLKRKEAAIWLKEQHQKYDDKIIFENAFQIISVFKVDEECNYFRKHYFAKRLTKSDDTLKRAMVILVRSLYNQIPRNCVIKRSASAVVFLYKSLEDYKKQKPFSKARLYQNQSLEVLIDE